MRRIAFKIIKFTGERSMLVHLVFVALVLSLAIAWYVYSGVLSQVALEDLTLHRQQSVARSGSLMIQEFIRSMQRSENNFIFDTDSLKDIDLLQARLSKRLEQFSNTPVSAIGVLDKEGREVVTVDRGGGVFKGTDYSERAHFLWAKSAVEGEFNLSKPVISKHGAEQGKYIAVLSTPIYINGEFNGLLGMAFSVSRLTEMYVDPIKLTDSSRIYLLENDGIVTYAPIDKLNGTNYFDVLKTQNFEGRDYMENKMYEALKNPGEGKFKGQLVNEETHMLTDYLIAYSPIYFNNQKIWTLGVASPNDVALDFVGPLFDNQNKLLTFLVIVVIGFSLIGITGRRIGRNEIYVRGFEDGRKSKDN